MTLQSVEVEEVARDRVFPSLLGVKAQDVVRKFNRAIPEFASQGIELWLPAADFSDMMVTYFLAVAKKFFVFDAMCEGQTLEPNWHRGRC